MARDHRTVLVALEGRAPVPVPLKTALGVRNRAARRGDHATVDRIGDALQAAGICRECGRTLTNPKSVEAGIGPECGPRAARRRTPQPTKET